MSGITNERRAQWREQINYLLDKKLYREDDSEDDSFVCECNCKFVLNEHDLSFHESRRLRNLYNKVKVAYGRS
jgi:hypothetical protein